MSNIQTIDFNNQQLLTVEKDGIKEDRLLAKQTIITL